MKKILVPTDFSETSVDAFQYACHLAEAFDASIRLVHVAAGGLSLNQPLVIRPNEGRSETNMSRLQNIAAHKPTTGKGGTVTQVRIDYEELLGQPIPQIVKEAKKIGADLIVMGTTGSHNMVEKTLGSVSTGVAQRAECPVLLVPTDVVFKRFDNVLYASNYESVDEEMVDVCLQFAERFGAAMHFVHVSEDEDTGFDDVEDRLFDMLFGASDPSFAVNLVTLPKASVKQALFQYAEENNIDLIVLVNEHESLWDNVLSKSLTKEMGLYTKFPLLIFQD